MSGLSSVREPDLRGRLFSDGRMCLTLSRNRTRGCAGGREGMGGGVMIWREVAITTIEQSRGRRRQFCTG